MSRPFSFGVGVMPLDVDIDADLPFAEVRRRFRRPADAFVYFAFVQQARYPLEAATAARQCWLCGRSHDVQAIRLTWRAMFRTWWDWVLLVVGAIGHVHVSDESWLRFVTFHPMCSSCFRSWRWGRIGWDVVTALGIIGVCAGAVAAMLGLLFGYFGIMNDHDTRLAIQTGWAGVLVLLGGVGAARLGRRLRVPVALRKIGSGLVELEAAAVVDPEINEVDEVD